MNSWQAMLATGALAPGPRSLSEVFATPFQTACISGLFLAVAFGMNYPSWRLARRKGRKPSFFRCGILDFAEFDRTEWAIFAGSLIRAVAFAGAAIRDAQSTKSASLTAVSEAGEQMSRTEPVGR